MKANLLRVVKSALARPPRPLSEHPDANLLAAFAENTLLARERAAVAGHLADCAECREFLALAFGTIEAEPAAEVQPRAARRWSPVWNWAASTAAICIVVSAVWEFRAQRGVPVGAPPGPPAIYAPAPAAMPSEPPATASTVAPAQRRFAPPRKAVAASKHLEAPVLPPPPPAPPAPSPTTDALAKVEQIPAPLYDRQISAPEPGARYLMKEQAPAAPPPPAAAGSAPGIRRKAASGYGAMQGQALAGAAAPRVVSEAPPVRWTIAGHARGIVQRSDDGGATWQTVEVNHEVDFRAVAHFGSDVWAGGSAGALFHSVDSGAHWERVSMRATGDIAEIEDEGRGKVRVTTNTGREWLTHDNGRSWRLTEDTPR